MNKQITKEDISKMQKGELGTCISLYMATPNATVDNAKNFITFKNKLTQIDIRLENLHMPKDSIETFVDSAKQFYNDCVATGSLNKSIAIFYGNKKLHGYVLPIVFEDMIDIGNKFNVKPLEEYLKISDLKYYVLSLDQNKIILYLANAYEMVEVPLKIVNSIEKFYGDEEYSSNLQFRPSNGAYSIGDKKSEDKKKEIERYFMKINDEVVKIINNSHRPLILVGVEYLFPIYKNVNTYNHLLDKGVKGSPDSFKKEKLHEETLKIFNEKK